MGTSVYEIMPQGDSGIFLYSCLPVQKGGGGESRYFIYEAPALVTLQKLKFAVWKQLTNNSHSIQKQGQSMGVPINFQ